MEITTPPPLENTGIELASRPRGRVNLLPDSLKNPLVLFWAAIVPQLLLLWLNWRDYQLVSGEMTAWQKSMATAIGGCELFFIVGSAGLIVFRRARRRQISWQACWGLLVLPICYLWFFCFQIDSLIPTSVAAWMLPPEQVMYNQFALVMPLIFYAGLRLSCVDLPNLEPVFEYSSLAAAVFGIPIIFALAVQLPWGARALANQILVAICIAFITLGTFCVLAAACRLVVIAYLATSRKSPRYLAAFSFLVAIAGPIGGLLLNRTIPFPADFQSIGVYAMALLNGALLLLPNFRNVFVHRFVWLAQCALFPFTLYFFVVFLPFLPLSLPAMIAVGAGFLVLVPTLLFFLHGQRLLDGFGNEIRDGSRLKPLAWGLTAMSLIPLGYLIEAKGDQVVLRHAIDYIYSPDYRAETHFGGQPALVRRSLENLRDFKEGLDLPFLSRFYNWMVFDGLVLPEEKMQQVYRAFFAADFPPAKASSGIFARRRAGILEAQSASGATESGVSLTGTNVTVAHETDCDRATVALQMHNQSLHQAEFATAIHLPEGVLVSGFWLHLGAEKVPGQLFEKKTALWVYQKIKTVRRDPGLLLYTDAHDLELRVFPFAPNETRQVEIEFLYPSAISPTLRIGNETLHPSGENAAKAIVATNSAKGTNVWLGAGVLRELPAAARAPYLHFIVDASAGSDVNAALLAQTIAAARRRFPEARDCRFSLANYESVDLTNELRPLESAPQIDLSALPRRGGFLAERAIKHALLRYHDELAQATPEAFSFGQFPIFIIVRGTLSEPIDDGGLSVFAKLVPDTGAYYISKDSGLAARSFAKSSGDPGIRRVALVQYDRRLEICPLGSNDGIVLDFAGTRSGQEIQVFDPAARSFVPLTPVQLIPSHTRYAAGTGLWRDCLALTFNPSLGPGVLSEVVQRSRETSIMVASTSFIVVENSAQWKILQRKENQKLGNNAALELEETSVPEPPTWCLMLGGGAFLFFVARRRRARCL